MIDINDNILCICSYGACEIGKIYTVIDICDDIIMLEDVKDVCNIIGISKLKSMDVFFVNLKCLKDEVVVNDNIKIKHNETNTIIECNYKGQEGIITITNNPRLDDICVTVDCPSYIVNTGSLHNHYVLQHINSMPEPEMYIGLNHDIIDDDE